MLAMGLSLAMTKSYAALVGAFNSVGLFKALKKHLPSRCFYSKRNKVKQEKTPEGKQLQGFLQASQTVQVHREPYPSHDDPYLESSEGP